MVLLFGLAAALPAPLPAFAADDMPPPKSAPRIKVQQKKLPVEEGRGNRVVSGTAKPVDGERIKIADTELRLFGIVMPLQTAPHGQNARAALEKLLENETLNCRIQERDKSWRILGACKTAKTPDISLALLQQGWAVVARGSVQQTDYADTYLAAEAKAQIQKLGMWVPTGGEAKPAAEPAAAETAAAPAPREAEKALTLPTAAEPAPSPASAVPSGENTQPTVNAMPEEIASAAVLPVAALQNAAPAADTSLYWLWFAGLTPAAVMILFACGQIALRRYEYRQERKALAAALRGELMAARAICISRADTLGYGPDAVSKLSSIWPRLRSTIYQAYVGRIGLLGPDLARRVSSLYGQFADYAQFYAARPNAEAAGKIDNATVQQTLFTIIDHIEDTLHNLQQVEISGRAPSRLLPPRPNPNSPRNHRLPEKPRTERLEYVEAEIVEDEMAAKSAATAGAYDQDKFFNGAPETTETTEQPAAMADNRPADAPAAGEEPGIPAQPPVITQVIRQGETPSMTEATLATITATHDAMHADEEQAAQEKPAEAAPQDMDAEAAADAAEKTVPSDAVAAPREEQPRKSGARRRNRAENKDDKAEEPGKDEYYDFRSQAVRIATK